MNATAQAHPVVESAVSAVAAPAKALVLETFFAGRSHARGAFYGRFDKTERWFSVVIDGTWDGTTLTMVEDFTYDDGELDHKTWRFVRTGQRSYRARREDVIGSGRAYAEGPAMRLDYVVALKMEKWGVIHLRFADTLTLQPDGTVLNRAVVSKWGIRLGHVEIVMTRERAA
jgi:hypothetical protein